MKRSLILLLLASPFAALQLASGCGSQGEGQLCSTLNGNADCADGLACVPHPNGYTVCCPPSGSVNPACTASLATTVATTTTTTTGGGGGAGGSGTGGSVTPDGGTDGGVSMEAGSMEAGDMEGGSMEAGSGADGGDGG